MCLRRRGGCRRGGQALRPGGGVGAGRHGARRCAAVRGRPPRPGVPGLHRRPGAQPPRRRLRAGTGHVPALCRRQDPPGRRAGPSGQRRHPRGHHLGPGRARRLRPVGARAVRRVRRRRRERLHRHGGRHRGALAGIAGRWRVTDHAPRDPHPGPRQGRHRASETALAAPAGQRRGHGSRGGDRAGLRLRRGGHHHHGHPHRRRLARQRRQDLVHLRRPGGRPDAAGPHRPRPLPRPPRAVVVRGPQAPGRGPRLPVHAGRGRRWHPRGRPHGGPADRHHRLPRDALLRDRLRRLVRVRRRAGRRRQRPRQGLLPADGRLRERPTADGGTGHRGDAGRVRGCPAVRPRPLGLRPPDRRLPAHQGQARRAWP